MASSKPRTYFQGNKQLIRELIQLSQQNRREDLLPLGRSFFLYFFQLRQQNRREDLLPLGRSFFLYLDVPRNSTREDGTAVT